MSDVMLAAAVILEENTPLSAKSQNKNNLSTQNNNFSTQNNFTTQNNYSEKNNFSTQNNINNINNLNNLSSNNSNNIPSSKHDQTLRGNSCGTSLCYNTASSSSSFWIRQHTYEDEETYFCLNIIIVIAVFLAGAWWCTIFRIISSNLTSIIIAVSFGTLCA